VWCWGANDHGQLGNGTETSSWVPVRVSRINSAVAVSAGGTWNAGGKGASLSAFACAVLRNGAVVCWGDTFGNADLKHSTPHTISGVNDALAIACGNAHACALTSSGAVWCWGENGNGQLGSATTNAGGPVRVQGIADATAVAGQGSDFSCAVRSDDSVWCWGKYNGGTDFASAMAATFPVRVWGVSTIASGLAVGRSGACAVSREGKLQCWGLGQPSVGPTSVQGLRAPAVEVSGGAMTTCALLDDQAVQCWGEGERGQLGNGVRSDSKLPVDVSDIADVAAVSVGYVHACALSKTGSVRCGGANDGGLGSGSPDAGDSLRPVPVTGL
jgi:alpha-tubulin suppressor-like RCC1 family protein